MGFRATTTDPTERMRLMNEARRENQAKIAELLGPEKLKLLEQYQQTIPVRQEVDMLARQLDGSDAAPLSEDQRKRLLAALIEERNRIPTPDIAAAPRGEDFKKTYLEWQDDYNERVAAQARSILDAEQYAAYDEYQQWQKEMNEQMSTGDSAGGRAATSCSPPRRRARWSAKSPSRRHPVRREAAQGTVSRRMTADEQEIRELVATWMSATKAGDLPTVLSLMTDDVVFLVAGQQPFGKQQFAAAMKPGAAGTPCRRSMAAAKSRKSGFPAITPTCGRGSASKSRHPAA